eukprot:2433629-Alexandrium_andersonii.AAC.1
MVPDADAVTKYGTAAGIEKRLPGEKPNAADRPANTVVEHSFQGMRRLVSPSMRPSLAGRRDELSIPCNPPNAVPR